MSEGKRTRKSLTAFHAEIMGVDFEPDLVSTADLRQLVASSWISPKQLIFKNFF